MSSRFPYSPDKHTNRTVAASFLFQATPYVGPIPGGLQDGTQIHVKGVAEHHHTG